MQRISNKPARRQIFYVDAKVQGALVARAISYWLFCLLSITLLVTCWRIVISPPQMFHTHLAELWLQLGPAAVASLLLLPLVVYDVVRLSNRFAGPLIRMRRAMRALARGEQIHPIKFRDGDYWQEFADDFNSVAACLQMSRAAASRLDAESPDADDSLDPAIAVESQDA